MLFIIAKWYKQQGKLNGGVVGTQMSNLGLEIACRNLDIPFVRSKVGDRYVLEKLKENKWNLGGEASGHVICLDENTTGDGIVSALQVLGAMKSSNKELAELTNEMNKFPQILINVPVENPKQVVIATDIKYAVVKAEAKLKDMGRVLLRASGTEPLVRVMVEGDDFNQIQIVASELEKAVEYSS